MSPGRRISSDGPTLSSLEQNQPPAKTLAPFCLLSPRAPLSGRVRVLPRRRQADDGGRRTSPAADGSIGDGRPHLSFPHFFLPFYSLPSTLPDRKKKRRWHRSQILRRSRPLLAVSAPSSNGLAPASFAPCGVGFFVRCPIWCAPDREERRGLAAALFAGEPEAQNR